VSLTVFLSGVNVTGKVKINTLNIRKNINTKNTLNATFLQTNVQVGQEIEVKEGSATLFGGLVQNISRKFISPSETEVSIYATGYEQVCSRRTFGGLFTNKYAGEIIRNLLNTWLSPSSSFSEGFTEGAIENGLYIPSYTIRAKNFRDVLDDLSEVSGFKWWIDADKKLYFKPDMDILDSGYIISDYPSSNRLNDVRDLKVEESLSGYRNKQFVLGAVSETDYVLGISQNNSEIARMQNLYGSGIYGHVIINKNLTSDLEAKIVADSLIEAYARIPRSVSFGTTQHLDVAKTILVHVNSINITTLTKFLITEVNITQQGKEVIYYCKCDYYDDVQEEQARLKDDWTDGFNSFVNKNKEDPNAVYFSTNIVLQWLNVQYSQSRITVEFDVPYTEPPSVSVLFVYDKKDENDGTRPVAKMDFHYGIDYIIAKEPGGNLKYTGLSLEVGGPSIPNTIPEGYFTIYAIGRFK